MRRRTDDLLVDCALFIGEDKELPVDVAELLRQFVVGDAFKVAGREPFKLLPEEILQGRVVPIEGLLKEGGHGKERGMVEGNFLCRVLVCNNAEGVHVGARTGKGRDGYGRQKALHICPACKKVPCIAFIKGRGAHELRAVYDRAPANCQDDVDILPFADGTMRLTVVCLGLGSTPPASKRVIDAPAAPLLMFS